MEEQYFKSKRHIKNVIEAGKLGNKKLKELAKKREEKYYLNPKKCLNCDKPIPYKKKTENKFCNNNCAATYNNKRRKLSEETKRKTSETLKRKYATGEIKQKNKLSKKEKEKRKNYSKIGIKECVVCKKKFVVKIPKRKSINQTRKTCSEKCKIKLIMKDRTYQNGSRKPVWYNNPWQGKVLLESSWEVKIADLLTNNNIKWIRPEPISWIDKKGKERQYFSDFYIEDKDIYLDPKNPYCMERDKDKMEKVCKKVSIIYGDLKIVEDYVRNNLS